MRKGAAGYVGCILSSAIRVTSTFADVAYSKASDSSGAFFVVVVDNLPQRKRKSKPKYVKLSTSNSNILCFVENYKKRDRITRSLSSQIEPYSNHSLLRFIARAEDDFIQLVRRRSVPGSGSVITVCKETASVYGFYGFYFQIFALSVIHEVSSGMFFRVVVVTVH